MMVCLDDPPPNDYPKEKIAAAVERTIRWAKRCKDEYDWQKFYFREEEDQGEEKEGGIGHVSAHFPKECDHGQYTGCGEECEGNE